MAGGRQRTFNKHTALEQAMRVFWKKGYVGASLADLTQAMNINKPSLYGTFGNKEALFLQTIDHYLEQYAAPCMEHLKNTDLPLRTRLKNYLFQVVRQQCALDSPKGCFVSLTLSESEGGALSPLAQEAVDQLKNYAQVFLTEYLQTEMAKGTIHKNANPKLIAQYLVVLMHGTSAMARSGMPLAEMEGALTMALDTLCDQHGIT